MKAEALAKRRNSRALHSDDPLQILYRSFISSFLENTLMRKHDVCMRLHFSMLTNFISNCIQINNSLGNIMCYNQIFPKAPLKNCK